MRASGARADAETTADAQVRVSFSAAAGIPPTPARPALLAEAADRGSCSAPRRTPAEVFAFLRDKDRYPQKPGSPVLALELLTPEPPGRGSRYREVVRMLPWYTGQITSVVTRFDPPHGLAEDFVGPGMRGHLEYEIAADPAGTLLVQRERLHPQGALRLVTPVIRATLARRLRSRLDGIKAELDAGWVVDLNRENRRGHR